MKFLIDAQLPMRLARILQVACVASNFDWRSPCSHRVPQKSDRVEF